MTARTRPRADPLLLACALLPAAALATFSAFVVRARLALGQWPAPYRPDPKDLGFDLHHTISVWLLAAGVLSPLALGASLLVHRTPRLRERPMARALVVFSASYLLLVLLFVRDPGAFLAWLAD